LRTPLGALNLATVSSRKANLFGTGEPLISAGKYRHVVDLHFFGVTAPPRGSDATIIASKLSA
jgi:hypothetical protein